MANEERPRRDPTMDVELDDLSETAERAAASPLDSVEQVLGELEDEVHASAPPPPPSPSPRESGP